MVTITGNSFELADAGNSFELADAGNSFELADADELACVFIRYFRLYFIFSLK